MKKEIMLSPLLILSLLILGAVDLVKYDIGVHTAFFVHIPQSDNFRDNIYIVGLEDNTHFKIYDITEDSPFLACEGTINRGQIFEYKAAAKKFYKIISNKPLQGYIIGGQWAGWKDQSSAVLSGSIFHPSVEGKLVGREFFVLAGGSYYNPTPGAVGQGTFASPIDAPSVPERDMGFIKIFGLEDSHVKIFNATDGKLLVEFDIGPDMCRVFETKQWTLYHIISTGNIIVQDPGGGTCVEYAPSITGGYVGKVHYGASQAFHRGCFLIIAYEPCYVEVYDLDTGEKLFDHTFEGPGIWGFGGNISAYWTPEGRRNTNNLGTKNLKFVSTGNTAVLVGDTQDSITGGVIPFSPNFIGDDVTFVGGIDGKDFFFFTSGYFVIFAADNARVEVNKIKEDGSFDSTVYKIEKDRYVWVKKSGFFHVISNATIIIEAIFFGSGWGLSYSSAGLQDYATALISASEVSNEPPYKTSTVFENIMSNLLLYIIVAVAMVLGASFLLVYKRKK